MGICFFGHRYFLTSFSGGMSLAATWQHQKRLDGEYDDMTAFLLEGRLFSRIPNFQSLKFFILHSRNSPQKLVL